MSCARLNIAYVASELSRYTSNPSVDNWKAIVRVLRYLRYICNYGCTSYLAVLERFNDATSYIIYRTRNLHVDICLYQ